MSLGMENCCQGIKVAVNILVGFPGEAEEDFQMTVDFLRDHSRWIDRLEDASSLFYYGTPSRPSRSFSLSPTARASWTSAAATPP